MKKNLLQHRVASNSAVRSTSDRRMFSGKKYWDRCLQAEKSEAFEYLRKLVSSFCMRTAELFSSNGVSKVKFLKSGAERSFQAKTNKFRINEGLQIQVRM